MAKAYPKDFEGRGILENYSDEYIQSAKEFNGIISKTTYDCVEDNLVEVPKKEVLESRIDEVTGPFKKHLENLDPLKKTGKTHMDKLPAKSGITQTMIPKHCYYRSANETHGDLFVIDKHPDLPKGKRCVSTTSSKNVSTKKKFNQLIKYLDDLKKMKTSGSKTQKSISPKILNLFNSKTAKTGKPSGSRTSKTIKPSSSKTIKLSDSKTTKPVTDKPVSSSGSKSSNKKISKVVDLDFGDMDELDFDNLDDLEFDDLEFDDSDSDLEDINPKPVSRSFIAKSTKAAKIAKQKGLELTDSESEDPDVKPKKKTSVSTGSGTSKSIKTSGSKSVKTQVKSSASK